MDINELIKFYSPTQKIVFSSFCIQLPVGFTILYLYVVDFKDLQIYLQIIFAVTATILALTLSNSLLFLASALTKWKYRITMPIISSPNLGCGIILLSNTSWYYKISPSHIISFISIINFGVTFLIILLWFIGSYLENKYSSRESDQNNKSSD